MPAADSLRRGAVPMGLAKGLTMELAVKAGEIVRWSDVRADASDAGLQTRREMERRFAPKAAVKAAE
jgi:predicted homoserine dehydrogenase-like protein